MLIAANLGAASDADLSLTAGGLLRTSSSQNALASTARLNSQLGGRISLNAARIEHGGAIRVGSGRVELGASESIVLDAGSLLDVSGALVSAGGRMVGSSAGDLRLNSAGTIDARAGATLRASAAGDADAGTVGINSAGRTDFGATLIAQAGQGRGAAVSPRPWDRSATSACSTRRSRAADS